MVGNSDHQNGREQYQENTDVRSFVLHVRCGTFLRAKYLRIEKAEKERWFNNHQMPLPLAIPIGCRVINYSKIQYALKLSINSITYSVGLPNLRGLNAIVINSSNSFIRLKKNERSGCIQNVPKL